MDATLVKLIFKHLKETGVELSDKELKRLSKRCINACNIYIKSKNITDDDDHILNLKVNYLLMKLDKNIITKIVTEESVRVKDLLNSSIYETHPKLKIKREELLSKIVDINAYSCNLYKCPRCKAREHTYREIQSRSIDEPKSIKCICLVCGMKFGIG